MKKSEMIDNIYKDLEETLTKNQILSVIHLAESYGMIPPTMEFEVAGTKFRDNGWEREDGK